MIYPAQLRAIDLFRFQRIAVACGLVLLCLQANSCNRSSRKAPAADNKNSALASVNLGNLAVSEFPGGVLPSEATINYSNVNDQESTQSVRVTLEEGAAAEDIRIQLRIGSTYNISITYFDGQGVVLASSEQCDNIPQIEVSQKIVTAEIEVCRRTAAPETDDSGQQQNPPPESVSVSSPSTDSEEDTETALITLNPILSAIAVSTTSETSVDIAPTNDESSDSTTNGTTTNDDNINEDSSEPVSGTEPDSTSPSTGSENQDQSQEQEQDDANIPPPSVDPTPANNLQDCAALGTQLVQSNQSLQTEDGTNLSSSLDQTNLRLTGTIGDPEQRTTVTDNGQGSLGVEIGAGGERDVSITVTYTQVDDQGQTILSPNEELPLVLFAEADTCYTFDIVIQFNNTSTAAP